MPDPVILSKAVAVQTQEEERFRIARALQSGPAQVLANAAVEIETCLAIMEEQPDAARSGLKALVRELRAGSAELRDLVTELRPPLLDELGLVASVRKYAEDYTKRTQIHVGLYGWDELTERLPTTMETAIFRIIQEALENIRAHAHATLAKLQLTLECERLAVVIEDNGRGFAEPCGTFPAGRRLGLVGMSDRAQALGGRLQVFSEPTHGVRVVLTVPRPGRTLRES